MTKRTRYNFYIKSALPHLLLYTLKMHNIDEQTFISDFLVSRSHFPRVWRATSFVVTAIRLARSQQRRRSLHSSEKSTFQC